MAAAFVLAFLSARVSAKLFGIDLGLLGSVLGMVFGIAGTAALVIGAIGVIKGCERSLLVFLALPVGLYALLFTIFLIWLLFLGGSLLHLRF